MSAVFSSPVEGSDLNLLFLPYCPRCEGSLSVHQPDPELPKRLLATCDECKSWYLTNDKVSELRFIAPPAIDLRVRGCGHRELDQRQSQRGVQ